MINEFFDRYALGARVVPAAWVVLPALVAAMTTMPETREVPLLFLAVAAIGLIFLAEGVRDRGRRAEVYLFDRWGGAPTVRRLRFSSASDPRAVTALHERLSVATGVVLPDADAEMADPAAADLVYGRAVEAARERTRAGHPVVFSELTTYGRRRNTWAMRGLGRIVAVVGLVVCAISIVLEVTAGALETGSVIGFAAECMLVAHWFVVVREAWVSAAADRYADALFSAVCGSPSHPLVSA